MAAGGNAFAGGAVTGSGHLGHPCGIRIVVHKIGNRRENRTVGVKDESSDTLVQLVLQAGHIQVGVAVGAYEAGPLHVEQRSPVLVSAADCW